MCDHEDGPRAPLTFARFVQLLRQPPFEPCASELQFLTPPQYLKAFNEAVRLHHRKIVRLVAGITGDYDGAADLAQTLFLNLYRAQVSFEKAYVYRSAKNAAYGAILKTRRRLKLESQWAGIRQRRPEVEAADPRPLPDAELVERAREEALSAAVERLPERFRVALLLRADGNSYRRIGELTQASEGAVKVRVCRGKSILRRRLRAYL